ncbi:DNA-binding LacI/PurR family transcriptional regulator [Caldalkalibacillus uzonensis]|uniref:DNA-binding LacI/PurR family transcriptional regulator n=1 Tax=Caldalkalibacillus uzonensis TaxID=353224 RepID=A0ABU0CLR3_9BACI|nr:LacI family DNA-binding transcriptional regulator [Caldalkalibacillus uzonensis]MDQ0337359.1 DNA-binding LacI/PurR family transcriptional regulator [Caldalkalibacillus uzonensis]
MATIKDVARKAGVSVATVSAVINKSKYVSDDLKQRVQQAIEDLGYRPNRVARSLKRKESNIIGITVTEITNPFYPLMLEGVEDNAINEGYNVMLCTTGDDEEKEYLLLESMIDQGVDGVILATIDDLNSKALKLVQKEGIPHVLINRAPENYTGSLVCVDSYKVGQIATKHLLQLGHTQIGFIGGNRQNSKSREKGYQAMLASHNIPVNPSWIIDGEYSMEKTYEKITKLMQTSRTIPTAFFAASDLMAFGAAKALLDNGYTIPGDISIVGSDNIDFSEDFRVPLTTVDVQKYEIGKLGCELLLNHITRKEEVSHQKIILEPSLVLRESSGAVRKK